MVRKRHETQTAAETGTQISSASYYCCDDLIGLQRQCISAFSYLFMHYIFLIVMLYVGVLAH